MESMLNEIKLRQTKLLFDGYYITKEYGSFEESLTEGDIPDTFYWKDIDYADQTRSAWGSEKHYGRILSELAKNGKERLGQDAKWRTQLLGTLKYWLAHDFTNPNWWYNQIGVPQAMSNIALMLEPYLPVDMKEKLLGIIARGSMKPQNNAACTYAMLPWPVTQWTGANLLWGAAITVKHALLTEDSTLLASAADRICEELKYDVEGIQPDGAFCQHGPRWYSGGYGRSFVFEIAPFIYCFQGTSYAFPEEKTEILLKHILDGQRLMQKSGYFDYGAVGRELTRPNDIHAGCLIQAVKLLADTKGIPRQQELQEFWKELTGQRKESKEETKFFESICLLRHGKADRYIGIRGSRPEILGAEQCNNEGVLCYNMTYGTNTCFMQSGKEYYNLAPVWDYAKIPGTTARQETDEQLLTYKDWEYYYHTGNRTAGMTRDNSGILSEFVSHDGISLHTSFFVFDGCMAALGADIQNLFPEKGALLTTVDQCHAGVVQISEDKKLVENEGWCYRNLDNETSFIIDYGTKTGSWHRNNLPMSPEPVRDEVFTLTIPVKDTHNAYAYLVSPGDAAVDVEVLCNDETCQAILVNKKTVMAAFHKDTVLCTEGKKYCGQAGTLKIFDK